jgi:hypothetical protein
MTYKEWNAAISLTGSVLVGVWLVRDLVGADRGAIDASDVAIRLLWAIVFMVVFNIVALIALSILGAATRNDVLKDERSDERDRVVTARSLRNAYFVASIGGAGTLLLVALGGTPVAAVYVLFSALLLAGATDAVSRLLYYRVG